MLTLYSFIVVKMENKQYSQVLEEILKAVESDPNRPQGLEPFGRCNSFTRDVFAFFYELMVKRVNVAGEGESYLHWLKSPTPHSNSHLPFVLIQEDLDKSNGHTQRYVASFIWQPTKTLPPEYKWDKRKREFGKVLADMQLCVKGIKKFARKNKYTIEEWQGEKDFYLPSLDPRVSEPIGHYRITGRYHTLISVELEGSRLGYAGIPEGGKNLKFGDCGGEPLAEFIRNIDDFIRENRRAKQT